MKPNHPRSTRTPHLPALRAGSGMTPMPVFAALVAAGVVLSAGGVHAATKDFTDASPDNSTWNNGANWSPAGKPASGDLARISNNHHCLLISQNQAATQVYVSHLNNSSGKLTIRNNRTLTVSEMRVGQNGDGTGTLDLGSATTTGTLTLGGSTFIGGAGSAIGVLNLINGTHQTGVLDIGRNNFAGSSYNIQGGAATTLRVTRTAALTSGNLNIVGSRASISFGKYVQEASGTILNFEADASGFSPLNVAATGGTGDGTVNLGGTLVVNLAGYANSPLEHLLISNEGTSAINGTFSSVTLLNNTHNYTLTYTGGDGNDLALRPPPPPVAARIDIPINTNEVMWDISERVVGLHMAYTFTPDSAYADGKLAAWTRRTGISTSRFPGGTVLKFWDWENTGGQSWIDYHHPNYNPANNVAPSQWMSLDEYLDFVEASGIEPHFGVNTASASNPGPSSHYSLISEANSIDRAKRMVSYAKQRGHGGAWWYLGNEEVHWHGGIVNYAKVCRRYAQAMKSVDPTIKIFWNDNNASSNNNQRVKDFLNNDGGWLDGLETHGKWPYGGSQDLGVKTLSYWQNDFPLQEYDEDRKWRFAANQYRNVAAGLGRTLLIANNEYGIGKPENLSGFSPYTKGLLLTEFLMEMFQGNWDMSSFWDMVLADRPQGDSLLDATNGYRLNPFHFGMNMLADAQGGKFLARLPAHAVVTANPTLQGFAARKDGVLLVYLLNKSATVRPVRLQLQGSSYPSGFARQMQNSTDGYGKMINVQVQSSGTNFTADLPPFSFTEFVLADPAAFLRISDLAVSNNTASLSWTSLPGAKFTIEESADLLNWVPAQSDISPDNLWTDSVIEMGTTEDKRFFRIRQQP